MSWIRIALCAVSLVGASAITAAAQSIAVSASSAATGAIEGTVLSDSLERPVAKAEVELADLGLKVTTDSAGNFSIKNVPPGEHRLVIRADEFGLLQTTLVFHANETLSRDFLLVRDAELRLKLDKRRVSTPDAARLAEFEARRRTSAGHFLTRADFSEDDGQRALSNILVTKIPGLRVISNNGERSIATGSRGRISFGTMPGESGKQKQCYVQVIVDGIVQYRSALGEKLFNIDNIDSRMVSAVEFYTVSQTPLQFNSTGGAPCGTLVIWQSM